MAPNDLARSQSGTIAALRSGTNCCGVPCQFSAGGPNRRRPGRNSRRARPSEAPGGSGRRCTADGCSRRGAWPLLTPSATRCHKPLGHEQHRLARETRRRVRKAVTKVQPRRVPALAVAAVRLHRTRASASRRTGSPSRPARRGAARAARAIARPSERAARSPFPPTLVHRPRPRVLAGCAPTGARSRGAAN